MPGIKVGRSQAQLPLKVEVEEVAVPEGFVQKLNDHLLLVYTGNTRLARNLLQVSPGPRREEVDCSARLGLMAPALPAGCAEELVRPAARRCAERPPPGAADRGVCRSLPPR